MNQKPRVGVYPGSFNPPTIAHLELSDAARRQHRLDRMVWSVSRVALAKEHVDHPRFVDRVEVLEHVASEHEWLDVQITDAQLLVEVARGFDLLVMGADKWVQINELHWYGSEQARDAAIADLPPIAVAPRPPHEVPPGLALEIDDRLGSVSSSNARSGEIGVMLPAAVAFAERTGAWLDPDRYDRWLASTRPPMAP